MRRVRVLGVWGLAAACALGLFAFGCSCGGDDEEAGNYSDRETKDAGAAPDDSSSDTADAGTPAQIDPVKFDKLLPYLPAGGDCTAREPKGSTTAMPGYKLTIVSNHYDCAGEPVPTLDVDITDGGYAQMVTAPFQMMSQMSTETTEGYQKGVTIDGHPGFETWDKNSRRSELTLLVGNRYLVSLKGQNMEPETVREWLEKIDLGELADLS